MQLKRCVTTETLICKSDEEITKFFRAKYLLVLKNERRFDENLYGRDSIIAESKIEWLAVNTQAQT